jgi:hypothetical protein
VTPNEAEMRHHVSHGFDQDDVASLVAVSVVDALEQIEIHHRDRARVAVTLDHLLLCAKSRGPDIAVGLGAASAR